MPCPRPRARLLLCRHVCRRVRTGMMAHAGCNNLNMKLDKFCVMSGTRAALLCAPPSCALDAKSHAAPADAKQPYARKDVRAYRPPHAGLQARACLALLVPKLRICQLPNRSPRRVPFNAKLYTSYIPCAAASASDNFFFDISTFKGAECRAATEVDYSPASIADWSPDHMPPELCCRKDDREGSVLCTESFLQSCGLGAAASTCHAEHSDAGAGQEVPRRV